MKNNTIKAFTLVEMLIVIVIIGILIASLMPRMQTAQGRARDVARKNDLSQIQTSIITSQADRKAWPGTTNNQQGSEDATAGISINQISTILAQAGMTAVPEDPNGSNVVYGLGTANAPTTTDKGQYIYLVATRNGVANAGFALMAKTEVEGSSNWVVCGAAASKNHSTDQELAAALASGYIYNNTDLADVHLCEKVEHDNGGCDASACKYSETGELRYLLLY